MRRMVEGKWHRSIDDRPCMRMPLLRTTATTARAMVTEVVAVVVATKTMAGTHTLLKQA